MISRYELLIKLNELLKPEQIKDYCPNGLQIEGNTNITRIATAVSATGSVIEQAIAQQAQALLVHHGFFWKGEPLT
jgi:putative NIF3 family GTP cyclohydrolase 1 type 2